VRTVPKALLAYYRQAITFFRARQDFPQAMPNPALMSNILYTRRELAQQAVAGAAGMLLSSALPVHAQAVDAQPPPLPTPSNSQANPPMPTPTTTEGELLIQLVPINVDYAPSEAQTKEIALQLKDYPGEFAKARAYPLLDDIGPAFAADVPIRKERVK
jgi:hypothetical protein